MEPPSPARLYAAAVGALLFIAGILGFFYDASFDSFGNVEVVLGVLPVNGWLNLLHLATGALGLLMAGVASRRYSLAAGVLYTALAIAGWGAGFHLVLGVLGLAAGIGTPKPARRPKRLQPRAQAAGERF